MKKTFFICFIAVSALALSTSAKMNNYQFNKYSAISDTTPPMMSDSMHHGSMKMHHKNKMMKDSTSGMTMSTDSTSTAPPKK